MLIYFTVLSTLPERKLSLGLALLKFHAGLLICFLSLFALLIDFYGYFILPVALILGIYLMISGYRDGKKLARSMGSRNKLRSSRQK